MTKRAFRLFIPGITDYIETTAVEREVRIEGERPRKVAGVETNQLARIYAPPAFTQFLEGWFRERDRIVGRPEAYWLVHRLLQAVPDRYRNLVVQAPERPRATAFAWTDDGDRVIEAASLEVAEALAGAPKEAEVALAEAYPLVVAEFDGGQIICDRRDAEFMESQAPFRVDVETGAVLGDHHDIPLKDILMNAHPGFEVVLVKNGNEKDLRRLNLRSVDIRTPRQILAPEDTWRRLQELADSEHLPFETFLSLKIMEIVPYK